MFQFPLFFAQKSVIKWTIFNNNKNNNLKIFYCVCIHCSIWDCAVHSVAAWSRILTLVPAALKCSVSKMFIELTYKAHNFGTGYTQKITLVSRLVYT